MMGTDAPAHQVDRRALVDGVRTAPSLTVGYLPFAVVLGASFSVSDADPWASWSSSWLLFGGAAQATGGPTPVLPSAEHAPSGPHRRHTVPMSTSYTPSAPSASDRLLDQRILVLGESVTEETANRLVAQLLVLSNDDPHSDICLWINSPGGSVMAGLAVYDAMQLVPNDVATVAIGFAASMGQILLCAGTAGKRYALPNAQVVMHEGSAGLGGSAADVAIQAENIQATLDRMRRIVAHHTGHDLEDVVRDVGRDLWFDAPQARDYGFVDHIVTSIDDILPRRGIRQIGSRGSA